MDRTACTEPQCLYEGELYLTLLYTSTRRDAITSMFEKNVTSIYTEPIGSV